jgi:hypothetical protein
LACHRFAFEELLKSPPNSLGSLTAGGGLVSCDPFHFAQSPQSANFTSFSR